MILTLRTDKPEAEIGLFTPDGTQQTYYKWLADRQLAKELLTKIKQQLDENSANFTSLTGIVVFQGPGSFTGLRIGITVANTLAYGLEIPIVTAQGEDWVTIGLGKLQAGKNERMILPHYGAEANITMPKK